MTYKTQSKALIEKSIAFSPQLAKAFGVCGALLIQQIHYWCMVKKAQGEKHDGNYWSWNTTKQLAEQLGCYEERTIKRVCMELRETGIVLIGNFNKMGYDRTLWYRLDYVVLCRELSTRDIVLNFHCPLGHFYTSHSVAMSQPIPKTITKTSGETSGSDFAEQAIAKTKRTIKLSAGKITDIIDLKESPMATTSTSSAILQNLKVANGTSSVKTKNTSGSAQALWRRLVPKHHPTVGMLPEFTIQRKGQLGHFSKALGAQSDTVLSYVIPNWIGFTKFVAGQVGLNKTPDVPDIGFLLKYAGEAGSYTKAEMQLIAPKPKPSTKKVIIVKEKVVPSVPNEPDDGDEIASADFMKNWKPPTD